MLQPEQESGDEVLAIVRNQVHSLCRVCSYFTAGGIVIVLASTRLHHRFSACSDLGTSICLKFLLQVTSWAQDPQAQARAKATTSPGDAVVEGSRFEG